MFYYTACTTQYNIKLKVANIFAIKCRNTESSMNMNLRSVNTKPMGEGYPKGVTYLIRVNPDGEGQTRGQ